MQSSHQCKSRTRAQKRCRKRTKHATQYCHLHRDGQRCFHYASGESDVDVQRFLEKDNDNIAILLDNEWVCLSFEGVMKMPKFYVYAGGRLQMKKPGYRLVGNYRKFIVTESSITKFRDTKRPIRRMFKVKETATKISVVSERNVDDPHHLVQHKLKSVLVLA